MTYSPQLLTFRLSPFIFSEIYGPFANTHDMVFLKYYG